MKQLISLEEHNKRVRQVNETGGNGIACPNPKGFSQRAHCASIKKKNK